MKRATTTKPAKPAKPAEPARPSEPAKPVKPARPAKPSEPDSTAAPASTSDSGDGGAARQAAIALGIRVGIGGWNYEPWRDTFYPEGVTQKQELNYASRQVTAIEINATYYGSQKPASFAKWRDDTPDDFVFAVKASRYCTNRRVLAEAADSIDRFIHSGISELGPKLGPLVWQFAPTKQFDADDFGAFLDLLPKAIDGLTLRHVMDVRNDSFKNPDYLTLARRHGAATVFTDADKFPSFADPTGDFIYARLMNAQADEPLGYAPADLDRWAGHARNWAAGETPKGLPCVDAAAPAPKSAAPREVFIFFINGAKEHAPAAASALLERLGALSGLR